MNTFEKSQAAKVLACYTTSEELEDIEKAIAVGTINKYGKQKQADGSWKYVGKNKAKGNPEKEIASKTSNVIAGDEGDLISPEGEQFSYRVYKDGGVKLSGLNHSITFGSKEEAEKYFADHEITSKPEAKKKEESKRIKLPSSFTAIENRIRELSDIWPDEKRTESENEELKQLFKKKKEIVESTNLTPSQKYTGEDLGHYPASSFGSTQISGGRRVAFQFRGDGPRYVANIYDKDLLDRTINKWWVGKGAEYKDVEELLKHFTKHE